jgi:hypothetical protein
MLLQNGHIQFIDTSFSAYHKQIVPSVKLENNISFSWKKYTGKEGI